MKFVNLTPHTLNILDPSAAEVLTLAPSGAVARVHISREVLGHADGVPLFIAKPGDVENLPHPAPDTLYIVSGMVRSAVPHRTDVFSPGALVRDDAGRPVGAIGLTR